MNYNDVYLYQKFLDIFENKAKEGDVIWYTIANYPSGIPKFSYTINDEIKERNNANREHFFNRQNNNPTRIIFDKITVNKDTMNYIKNKEMRNKFD